MNNQKQTTNNQQPTTNNKQTTNNQQQTTNLFLLFITIFWSQLGFIQVAQATNYCAIAPLEAELLVKTDRLREREIITADTISQTEITTPSLWWARDQIDPFRGRLIINWLAYQQEKRIDLIVNRQLWSLLNYLNRYSFVNQFGTVVREYEYNLRVFNQQQECLSTYTCNYAISPPRCEIQLDYDTDRL